MLHYVYVGREQNDNVMFQTVWILRRNRKSTELDRMNLFFFFFYKIVFFDFSVYLQCQIWFFINHLSSYKQDPYDLRVKL